MHVGNEYQRRKIEALQKENKELLEEVKTLQKMLTLHKEMLKTLSWKAMTGGLRAGILETLLEAPQVAPALQLKEKEEDEEMIKDILDMKEEFGSLPNLESTIIEQLNMQLERDR